MLARALALGSLDEILRWREAVVRQVLARIRK